MKFMKALAKGWLVIGGLNVFVDAIGLTTCRLLEKVGKPLESLSEVYNDVFDYSSAKVVCFKWVGMFFMWPVSLAATMIREIQYDKEKGDGA